MRAHRGRRGGAQALRRRSKGARRRPLQRRALSAHDRPHAHLGRCNRHLDCGDLRGQGARLRDRLRLRAPSLCDRMHQRDLPAERRHRRGLLHSRRRSAPHDDEPGQNGAADRGRLRGRDGRFELEGARGRRRGRLRLPQRGARTGPARSGCRLARESRRGRGGHPGHRPRGARVPERHARRSAGRRPLCGARAGFPGGARLPGGRHALRERRGRRGFCGGIHRRRSRQER